MMVTHYKTREEAELNCREGQSVVMDGNQNPRFRIINNAMSNRESNYWASFRRTIDKRAYQQVVC